MARKVRGSSVVFGACGCAVLLARVGVGLALGIASPFATSAPSFARARSYPTGRFPSATATADLNGDRRLDVATANASNRLWGTVSVLFNRGDGTFRAKHDYRTGRIPESIAVGDLNRDGKPDLATGNSGSGSVSVLINRGDGSFQATRHYRAGSAPASVAAGDLNGDGKPELAVASGAKTVSVFLNRGDGSFQPKRDYTTGGSASSVAIGDLNRDSAPDLATSNVGRHSVSVLLGKGDGSFQAKRDYRTGFFPGSLAIGDLNGDHKLDLVTSNGGLRGGTVSVLIGRGDGSFRARRDFTSETGGTYSGPIAALKIGDLNGDGKPDLAGASTCGTGCGAAPVFVNRGDGSFEGRLDYRIGPSPVSGRGPDSVAVGDLNGDRRLDLATANSSRRGRGSVSVLINRPGLCTVQDVRGMRLLASKRAIARGNCRVGKISRSYSELTKKGRVISQNPRFGAVLPIRTKVSLVVSLGPKPS